jgi:alkylhydroperoxidase family enzyme
VETRYDELIATLREAAHPEREAPPELHAYLEKVRLHAYRVSDDDVARLRGAFSEDELFEHTVATSVAAGLERLEQALEVMR